ncbi:hypothetical protein V2G26_010976 [Clonostachys chloroleuca]
MRLQHRSISSIFSLPQAMELLSSCIQSLIDISTTRYHTMNKKWELCVIFSPRFEYHIILSTKDKYSRRYPQAYVKETLSRWV